MAAGAHRASGNCPSATTRTGRPRWPAREQFRWALGGRPVNAELPGPSGFEGATRYVTPQDTAGAVPCGDDVDTFMEAVRPYVEAGFTEIALVQVGGDQQLPFIAWAEKALLPAPREL